MKKIINNFSRVLCALMLCAGIAFVGCTDDLLGGRDEDVEQGSGDNAGVSGAMRWSLDKVTEVSATFTGTLAVAASDLPFSQVTVYYSDAENFNINEAKKVSTTNFDADQKFTIIVTGLKPGAKYNYCLISEVKSEKIYGDVEVFTTESLVAPTLNAASAIEMCSAVISGKVNFPSETVSGVEYGFQYCQSADFASNVTTKKVTDWDSENKFSMEITSLTVHTTYYYRSYIKMNGVYGYGDVKSFTTKGIIPVVPSGYTNLSAAATANCYIISQGGSYCLLVTKGNQPSNLLHLTKSASLLWESLGTSIAPSVGDLIKSVSYKDGYIAFQTADTFKEGNAVIAAKDANGTILWSWHIWMTDQPQGQVYNNNAGTLMDRNLGATSATPGDVGALGLLYQWGRKDPFLGSSSISSNNVAKSTITWPSAVSSDSSNGTIEYATTHPTTFVKYNSDNYDWYYTGSSSTDNTRWTSSESAKSIYDPCPAGWRVPDGGDNGVWSNALGSSAYFIDESLYNSTGRGMNFSGKFGSASTIWYPASGYSYLDVGVLSNVGYHGFCWSASPYGCSAYYLGFYDSGGVNPSFSHSRASGFSVRCLQE